MDETVIISEHRSRGTPRQGAVSNRADVQLAAAVAIFPIPIVGTAVGGFPGGLIGGMAGNPGARQVVRGLRWLPSDDD